MKRLLWCTAVGVLPWLVVVFFPALTLVVAFAFGCWCGRQDALYQSRRGPRRSTRDGEEG